MNKPNSSTMTSVFGKEGFVLIASLAALSLSMAPASYGASKAKLPVAKSATDKAADKTDKAATKAAPEVPIENVVNVSTTELVDKPHEFLNKNVKFTAKFFAFTTLPLDYKPAMKSSKTHLGLLVLRPESRTPFSELKIAMPMPKEKDPANSLLTSLKDGDVVEITAKVFGTPMDEPWVDVLRLKRISSAPDKDKKDDKTAASGQGKEEATPPPKNGKDASDKSEPDLINKNGKTPKLEEDLKNKDAKPLQPKP
jgi:hypothetical protein